MKKKKKQTNRQCPLSSVQAQDPEGSPEGIRMTMEERSWRNQSHDCSTADGTERSPADVTRNGSKAWTLVLPAAHTSPL